ncbi:hypothetical protein CALVIDRAFT_525365 [Calocera viscosa TUFC12733]|uniref:Uncharacterized protein n=1 Tax=Calocera viscosa (strain TUFC12733) TaxID=1330018 RepID=A0A167Q0I5_CALVF|nr:hypothetical protein CALVIDRAFT_525365 [Calocera viscosa TUFC12733]
MLSFEEMVKQEEEILQKVHPTPADIPTCTGVLDEFLRSYAPGQQVRSLYRYGTMSGTSAGKWDDFMYCISLKAYSAEDRRDKWIRRRAEWWAKRRSERSSEDVWDLRTTPLPKWTPPHDPSQPSTEVYS